MISARTNVYRVLTSRLVICGLAMSACSTSYGMELDVNKPATDVLPTKTSQECCNKNDVQKTVTSSADTKQLTTASTTDLTLPTPEFVNEGAKKYFTDVELIDQFGRPQRLYSDLIRDRVVVIDAFFSSCTGVCPVLNERMTAIKKAFTDKLGDELLLLSITVDPAIDTPARLKEYSTSLRGGPHWLFLTGERDNLKTALSKLGMYTDDRENHSNLLLIGNDKTGLWKKAFGLAPIEEIVEMVANVLDDTGASDAAAIQTATSSK